MGNTIFEHISDENGAVYNEEFYETEEGATRILRGNDYSIDSYLEYPLFVGKTWRNNIGVLFD